MAKILIFDKKSDVSRFEIQDASKLMRLAYLSKF